jgi:putative ABC transport system substrate-binding protein
MRRRDFIVGASAYVCSHVALAQDAGRTYRIGSLHSAPAGAPHHIAFFQELRHAGFVADQNLVVDQQGYGLRQEQFGNHATQLADEHVDAILCAGDLAIGLAQRSTSTIPILGVTEDMVAAGLVHSLSRPDGNTTGVSILAGELDGKRQEFLFELIPSLRRIALLVDTNTLFARHLGELEGAATRKGAQLSVHKVSRVEEIGRTIEAIGTGTGDIALNVLATPLFFNNRKIIFERVAALKLPAVYEWPEMAADGGLVAYGPRIVEIYRNQVSRQMIKLLRGIKPAEIPIEQPTKFDLVLNLKTAKAIDLSVPAALLARADEVIE